jgi:hypothetical protein
MKFIFSTTNAKGKDSVLLTVEANGVAEAMRKFEKRMGRPLSSYKNFSMSIAIPEKPLDK